jgi:CHAD domain-containing protein
LPSGSRDQPRPAGRVSRPGSPSAPNPRLETSRRPDEPFDPAKVARDHRDAARSIREKLREFSRSPTADNLHGARIAIRRLRIATGLLPGKIRRKKGMKRYTACLEEFFRLSSRLRDTDVLEKELEERATDPELAHAIEVLRKRRDELARRGSRIADRLEDKKKRPKVDPGLISSAAVASRFQKKESKLLAEIHDRFAAVIEADDNEREIHEMRKAVKKLRYSLELLLVDDNVEKLLRSLHQWQDALGRIHDRDVLIRYLHRMNGAGEVSALVEKETRLREQELRSFVDRYGSSGLPSALSGRAGPSPPP